MALAGSPDRANDGTQNDREHTYTGFIKVRLGHSVGRSIIVPDQLVIQHAGWRFYQPSFFGPCIINSYIEPDVQVAMFSIDVGGPNECEPARVLVSIRSDAVVRRYEDGSHVYRCSVFGPERIQSFSTGRCQELEEGAFALRLFHHTTPENFAAICQSKELWSSSWNLGGTRRLENVAYGYLTSLPKIQNEKDLRKIAMASGGIIPFQTTSVREIEEVIELQVYRGDTVGRTASMSLETPWELISSPHLLLHQPQFEQAYYEVVGPEIYRLGMQPGCNLRIEDGCLQVASVDRRSFDYFILGDASSAEGIAAPYDEENTGMVMHQDKLRDDMTLFDFWLANQNTDQVTGRTFEPVRFAQDQDN